MFYSIFYELFDEVLQKKVLWHVHSVVDKNDIYEIGGSISGQGRGLGSIYKYNNAYFTGHVKYVWEADEIYQY